MARDEQEELNVVLNVRISPKDDERLRSYSVPRSHVARTALRLGLRLLEQRPELLVQPVEDAPAAPKRRRPE